MEAYRRSNEKFWELYRMLADEGCWPEESPDPHPTDPTS